MKATSLTILAIIGLTGVLGVASSAEAKPLAQRCDLNTTCPIPGDDGGITYFDIKPRYGTAYVCTATADKGSTTIYVYAGKEYNMTTGSGFYKVHHSSVIEIDGNFNKPKHLDDVGQIKIYKAAGSDANILCTIKKQ